MFCGKPQFHVLVEKKNNNNLRIKTNSLKLICAKLILRVFSAASNIFFLIAFLLVFYECFSF